MSFKKYRSSGIELKMGAEKHYKFDINFSSLCRHEPIDRIHIRGLLTLPIFTNSASNFIQIGKPSYRASPHHGEANFITGSYNINSRFYRVFDLKFLRIECVCYSTVVSGERKKNQSCYIFALHSSRPTTRVPLIFFCSRTILFKLYPDCEANILFCSNFRKISGKEALQVFLLDDFFFFTGFLMNKIQVWECIQYIKFIQ